MQLITGGIGFFDSGIGGLTVMHACRKQIPDLPFYYFGDNARAPYGNLSPDTIRTYTYEALTVFARLRVRAVVLACNTVTSVCVEEMRNRFPFLIIGTEPAVFPAVRHGGKVGVLTTCATANSARFRRLCQRAGEMYPQAELLSLPCDRLAQCIETHLKTPTFDYTPYLPEARVDSIVLGCTHYVWIRDHIQARYGVPVFDGNEGIARRLQTTLLTDGGREKREVLELPVLPFEVFFASQNSSPIFFFGGYKTSNKRIYEHLFV